LATKQLDIAATMGNCFGSEPSADAVLPDDRRRQMAEAAEKRLKESDGRGLKDPEGFKRKQLAQQKAAEQDMSQGGGEANLKWNMS